MNNLSTDTIKGIVRSINKEKYSYANCKKVSLTYHTFHCCPNCEYLIETDRLDSTRDTIISFVGCMIQERDLDVI